ncbi:MAG: cytochrome c biogenesis protein CcdA [Candidatus Micrarchaeota archaeon]
MPGIRALVSSFLFLVFVFAVPQASAQQPASGEHKELCVIYFYGEGCQYCARTAPFIDEVEREYAGKIKITRMEIYNNYENYRVFSQYCALKNIGSDERGIPTVLVGNAYLIGESEVKEKLRGAIERELASNSTVCPLQGMMACHLGANDTSPAIPALANEAGISIPLIIGAGLVDGINPCAFAVLIFLLAYLLSVSANRTRMLKAGAAYIIAVYASYFAAGVGLLSLIHISGFSSLIFKVAAVVALATGLLSIKDYFWYGKSFTLKIPESKKESIQKWVVRANIPAAVVLGFLVSMYELPCTGGVYLAILGMLANRMTQVSALPYLALYNLMFVLPLALILLAMYFGLKAEHIESWRESKKNIMKLAVGVLLLIFGIGMLVGWF